MPVVGGTVRPAARGHLGGMLGEVVGGGVAAVAVGFEVEADLEALGLALHPALVVEPVVAAPVLHVAEALTALPSTVLAGSQALANAVVDEGEEVADAEGLLPCGSRDGRFTELTLDGHDVSVWKAGAGREIIDPSLWGRRRALGQKTVVESSRRSGTIVRTAEDGCATRFACHQINR